MKINFLEISKVYQGYLRNKPCSKREACPETERILATVLTDAPKKERQLIVAHAANCHECSELLKRVLAISSGIDSHVDRYKAFIESSTKQARAPHNRLRSPIIRHKPIVISAAILCIFLCGMFLLVPRTRVNTRATANKERIALISPVNIKVEADNLQFMWKETPNVKNYIIELFDKTLNLVWRSEPSYEPRAVMPGNIRIALQPGLYFWVVTAVTTKDVHLKSDLGEFTIYR